MAPPPLQYVAAGRGREGNTNASSRGGSSSSGNNSSNASSGDGKQAPLFTSVPLALQALLEAGPRHPCLGFPPQAALAPLDSGGAFAGNNPVLRWPPRHSSEFQAVKSLGPRCVIAAFHASLAEPLVIDDDDGSSSSQHSSSRSDTITSHSRHSESVRLRGLCPGWRPSGVSAGPQRLSLTTPHKQPLTLPASLPSLPSLSAEPPKHKPGAGSSGSGNGGGSSGGAGMNGTVGNNNNGSSLTAACFGGRGGGPPLPCALVQSRGGLMDHGQRLLDALYAVGGVHVCVALLAAACDEARVATAATATASATTAVGVTWSSEAGSNPVDGLNAPVNDVKEKAGDLIDGSAVAGTLIVGVLELLAALLATGDERYRCEWAASHGFHAVGACLRSLPSGLFQSAGVLTPMNGKAGGGAASRSASSRDERAERLGFAFTRACGEVLTAAHFARTLPPVMALDLATGASSSAATAEGGGGGAGAASTTATDVKLVLPPDRILSAACLHGMSLDCSLWGPRPLAGSQAPTRSVGQKNSSSNSSNSFNNKSGSVGSGHSAATSSASTPRAISTTTTAAANATNATNAAAAVPGAALRAPCRAFVLGTPWAVWASSLRQTHAVAAACPSQLLDSVGVQPLLDALADAVHSADPELVANNPLGNKSRHRGHGSHSSEAEVEEDDDDNDIDEEDGYGTVLRAAQPLLFVLVATALLRPLPAPLPRNAKAEAELRANAANTAVSDQSKASRVAASDSSSSVVESTPPKVLKISGASGPHSSYNDEWALENPHEAHKGGETNSSKGSSESTGSADSGARTMPRYVRQGNRKDVLIWDGARWTLNGSKYKGDRAAFWHSGRVDTSTATSTTASTKTATGARSAAEEESKAAAAQTNHVVAPWPPRKGWVAHPDWHGDLCIEGGFDLDAVAAEPQSDDQSASTTSSGAAAAAAPRNSVPQAVANPRHPQAGGVRSVCLSTRVD